MRARIVFPATMGAGMLLGAGAYAAFALHDAAVKSLLEDAPDGAAALPVWQVLFVRSAFILAMTVAIGRTKLLDRAVRTKLKRKIMGRAVITLLAWLCYYSAARTLPLAQLLTLYFAAPLITTILAIPFLGETIPPLRWLSVGIGFAGVLVACDPGGVAFSRATILVLVAACFWGCAIILMRQVARQEGSLLQMFYTNLMFLAATGIASLLQWQPVTAAQAGLLLAVCAFGGLGQLCLFEAARRAPASVIATVEYTALIWAFVLGYIVFGDIPRASVFAGAGLILLAGAVLLAGERRRGITPAPSRETGDSR